MVKNTTGGSGHKSQARKLVSGKSNNIVRVSQEAGEKYAIVTKILGNGMCNVTTEDGATLLCHIRGKFKGRNKKTSIISSNSIVLVGIREWESIIKNCDLIEVYSADDVQQLRSRATQKIEKLEKLTSTAFKTTIDDSFVFSNDEPAEPYFAPIPEERGDEEGDADFIAFEDI
jgi:initiation factor 1A